MCICYSKDCILTELIVRTWNDLSFSIADLASVHYYIGLVVCLMFVVLLSVVIRPTVSAVTLIVDQFLIDQWCFFIYAVAIYYSTAIHYSIHVYVARF